MTGYIFGKFILHGTTPLERAEGSAMTERGPCGML